MTRASGWAGGSGRTGFNEQLHHLWRTRPVRLPRQGPIAGVAAGFGRRYGVDPVLVRVAFVVATLFGGAGVVLYLAAWLMLPSAHNEVSPAEGLLGRGHTAHSPTKTIVLIVALAIAISTMGPFGVGFGGSGLFSFALMLAGWWLLYLRQPEPPADTLDPFLAEGGIAATGYPGTMFPGGSPWSGATYGPYTKLPDHYEPDQPKDAATEPLSPNPATAPTEVVARASAEAEVTKDGDTEQLVDSPAGPRDSSQEDTVVLGKDQTPADRPEPEQRTTAAPGRTNPAPTHVAPTPSGWDPLGVAPLAWHLPEPAPAAPVVPVPPPRRPRSRLTPMVIGLAILAAAAAGAVAAVGVEWMTPARIGAVALAVVGLGLILGAFLRRGWGLLVVLAPLAGFVVLASMAGPVQFDRGAMGDHVWTPTTAADLASDYRVNMGDGTLDLRQLRLTENRMVNVDGRMADFRVILPPSMRVDTTCTGNAADLDCPRGITGPADGPTLTLNVDMQFGNVEVKRG
ncbi:PspC domain-containing protein [Nocardia transvalensis]|uniref:PspC domain-containing protein n=1 Tax=Nocardia transvalensis TaxID=37333 RepID=UPI00189562DA|nr:PspC domain-containing protein [Nocardia transvalensis]MBF6327415.1 PspC domain-containing protein [Nocardia transvalensis]